MNTTSSSPTNSWVRQSHFFNHFKYTRQSRRIAGLAPEVIVETPPQPIVDSNDQLTVRQIKSLKEMFAFKDKLEKLVRDVIQAFDEYTEHPASECMETFVSYNNAISRDNECNAVYKELYDNSRDPRMEAINDLFQAVNTCLNKQGQLAKATMVCVFSPSKQTHKEMLDLCRICILARQKCIEIYKEHVDRNPLIAECFNLHGIVD